MVIDISGSMSGSKIQLVKETLLFLVSELKDIDRLSLIVFDQSYDKLTHLCPMTEANKEKYKNIINSIHTRGSTNIKDPLREALNILYTREQINDTSAVMLLTDGQDNCGNNATNIREMMTTMDKHLKSRDMDYTVHTFGYGQDHDETILNSIAEFQNGNFYYIESNKYVDECFLTCLSQLMTVIGKKAEIQVFTGSDIKIKKKFGLRFEENQKGNEKKSDINGKIMVRNITSEMKKDFLMLVEVPALKGKE